MALERITFTEPQQAFVDGLINEAYTRAYKKAEEKYQAEIATLKAELDVLKNKKTFAFWRK